MNPIFIMEEVWRDVPGYEGLYQITISDGIRCRTLNYYRSGKVVEKTTKPNDKNRLYWGLTKDGKTTYSQAARWVAYTYPELIENEWFEGAEIDHKDGNPMNNHPSNLHWVTHKENMNNPNTRLLLDGKKKCLGRKPLAVLQYSRVEKKFVARYSSIKEAAEKTGLSESTIRNSCNKRERVKRRGDYSWYYDDR